MAGENTNVGQATYVLNIEAKVDASIQTALRQAKEVQIQLKGLADQIKNDLKQATSKGVDTAGLESSLKKIQVAIRGYDAAVGKSGSGAKAASASIQGWMDNLKAAEANLSTLPQKIALVNAKLEEMKRAGQTSGTTWQLYNQEAGRLVDIQRKLDAASKGSSEGFRRIGFAAQNTAFQMTDFAVSIQNGTKASVAFSQQVPQILGFFGPIGAALGLASVAIGVFAADWINSIVKLKSASKEFEDALKGVEDAIGNVGQATRTFNLDNVREEFNKSTASARENIRGLLEVQDVILTLQTQAAESALQTATKGLGEYGAMSRLFFDMSTETERIAKNLGLTGKTSAEIAGAVKDLGQGTLDAATFVTKYGTELAKSGEAGKKLLKQAMDLDKTTRDSYAAQSALTKLREQAAKAGATGQIALDKPVKEAAKAAKEAEDAFFKWSQGLLKSSEELDSIPEKIAYIQSELKTLSAAGLEGSSYFKVLTAESDKFAKLNFDEAVKALDPFSKGIVEAGQSMAKAVDDAELLRGKIEVLSSVRGIESLRDQYLAFAESLGKSAPVIDQVVVAIEKMRDSETGLRALRDAVDEAREKFQLTAEEVRKLEQALGIAREKMDEVGVAVGNTLANSLGGLVDTLTDSTKSFRDWAANLLKELGKLLIKMAALAALKKSMENSGGGGFWGSIIGAITGSAHGNAFKGATGLRNQVINSPHFFPMPMAGMHAFANGGIPGLGLAGESGPEAIIPLKRHGADLGVAASPVNIKVINQAGAEVKTTATNNADGTKDIQILIRGEVKRAFASGEMDATMRQQYGMRRAPA